MTVQGNAPPVDRPEPIVPNRAAGQAGLRHKPHFLASNTPAGGGSLISSARPGLN